jgi:hypothetical protein
MSMSISNLNKLLPFYIQRTFDFPVTYYILDTTAKDAISHLCVYCANNFKTIKSLEFKI